MKKNKIKVYVAGPYTKPDPCINTHKAIKIGDQLMEKGYVPFVPHLTHFWHTVSPKDYEVWMSYDNEWLNVCDAMLRFPGESAGADIEETKFRKLGKPVFHSIDALVEMLPPR